MIMVFSSSCALTDKEPIGENKEESLENDSEQPPESNNYQGLRFETTSLEFSMIEESFPRLVCLGDSVTFGWNVPYEKSYPFLLEEKLNEKYPEVLVINSGIGGQTIIDALGRLDSDVFYYNPQLVIINFGLNDAFIIMEEENNSEADFKNNIDLDTFTDVCRQLVDEISEKDIEIIIMSTNPVRTELLWENQDIAQKQEESYILYNQASRDIAEDYGLIFVDIWENFLARGELDTLIQTDGLHPNETGQALVSEILSMTLGSLDIAKLNSS